MSWAPFFGANPGRWKDPEVYGHGPQRQDSHGMGGSNRFYGSRFSQCPADERWDGTISQKVNGAGRRRTIGQM